MSSLSDVAGTEEDKRKGRTPKESISCQIDFWAYNEKLYDCHLKRKADGELSKINYTGISVIPQSIRIFKPTS